MGLSTNDLLQCRLICRVWRGAASRACRRLYVPLHLGRRDREFEDDNLGLKKVLRYDIHEELEEVSTNFTDIENIPWSAFVVDGEQIPANENFQCLSRKIIQVLGSHLWKLTLDGNAYADIPDILRLTPNLRELKLKWYYKYKGNGVASLRFLKRANLSLVYDNTVDFIKFLTESGAQLRHVKMIINPSTFFSSYSVMKLSSYLTNIPFVCLTISTHQYKGNISVETLRTLAKQKLGIWDLRLHLAEHSKPLGYEYLGLLEKILAINAVEVERLTLKSSFRDGHTIVPFAFPLLQKLKYLKLEKWSLLTSLKPTNVPLLENVIIQGTNLEPEPIMNFQAIYDTTAPYISVSRLEMSCGGEVVDARQGYNWNKMFPNLTTLEIMSECNNLQIAVTVFANTNLKHLTFHLWTEVVDANSLLFGVNSLEELELLANSMEDIPQSHDIHQRLSILSLKGTKLENDYFLTNNCTSELSSFFFTICPYIVY